MSETDEQFLDSMEQWVIGSLVFKREHRERLFALARRGAAVQWRPISEAPGGTMSLYWSTWAENGEPGCQLRYYPGIRTTHWMPLPPPPEKDAQP